MISLKNRSGPTLPYLYCLFTSPKQWLSLGTEAGSQTLRPDLIIARPG